MSSELAACVEFLQELIRIPSLPGNEGELASRVGAELERLGYEEVHTDEVGNVLGLRRGRGAAPPLLFNTHLDHVDVGDPTAWPHPPYGGETHDGSVWGRGAVDIKGPLAAQIHGVAALDEAPPGDVWISCVVQEEIGGVGARHLARSMPVPVVVVGEPSRNTLRRGHRGRTELQVRLRGRSVHASVPELGVNPLYCLGRFLAGLEAIEHPSHPALGPSSVAPTLLTTDQTSGNVVPAEVRLTCDWRNIPGQSGEDARSMLAEILAAALSEGGSGEVAIPVTEQHTYTGRVVSMPAAHAGYILEADHPAVRAAVRAVERVTGSEEPPGIWRFATDGGHFAERGAAPVGFGPGDERLAHTVDEHIEITALETAMAVNRAFALELAAGTAEAG